MLPPVQHPAVCVESQISGRRAGGSKKQPEPVRREERADSLAEQTASRCSCFLFPWYSTSHLAVTVVRLLRLLKLWRKTFSVSSGKAHELHQPQLSPFYVLSETKGFNTTALDVFVVCCCFAVELYMLKLTNLFFSFSVFLFFSITWSAKRKSFSQHQNYFSPGRGKINHKLTCSCLAEICH